MNGGLCQTSTTNINVLSPFQQCFPEPATSLRETFNKEEAEGQARGKGKQMT